MPISEIPNRQREFHCDHCNGKITIPWNLPPTTAPCPLCDNEITSPAIPVAEAIVEAPTPVPTPRPLPTPKATQPPVKESESSLAFSAKKTERPTKVESAFSTEARPSRKLLPAMLCGILALSGISLAAYFYQQKKAARPAPVTASRDEPPISSSEANFIRIGWQKEAYQLLKTFIAAPNSEAKLPLILNSKELSSKIEDFYGGATINDNDTPADTFSVNNLPEEDSKRGLFMMVYDQPPQFEMKEFFRPLASLEVQYGIDQADLLLSTLARVGNFAMEPLRVLALFKRTPEGLKLDWETFVQTKYRTFLNFVELPEIGQVATFRICIAEDVPDKGRTTPGTRTYRLADPANPADSTRLKVNIDSEIGRTLSMLNWRGTENGQPLTRTATVELKWLGRDDAAELEISRFICWEFLGLGGQALPAAATGK